MHIENQESRIRNEKHTQKKGSSIVSVKSKIDKRNIDIYIYKGSKGK